MMLNLKQSGYLLSKTIYVQVTKVVNGKLSSTREIIFDDPKKFSKYYLLAKKEDNCNIRVSFYDPREKLREHNYFARLLQGHNAAFLLREQNV